MEVVLSLKKFTFYSSTRVAYICGTVFQKTDLETPKTRDRLLEELAKNSLINLKFDCADPEKLKFLITDRIVKIKIFDVIKSTDPNRSHTFVADSLELCGL